MLPVTKMKYFRKRDDNPVTWFGGGGNSRNVTVFAILFAGTVLFSLVGQVESMVIRENPVRLRVLEYSSKNGSLAKVLNSRYSDLVVGEEVEENSQLVLECSSSYGPLRWIYSGDGHPEHKSYYTSRTRSDSTSSFTAYLSFPNGLSPSSTGQYACQNSYNNTYSNYVYLFVPKKGTSGKPSLFVPSNKKHDVVVSAGQKTARIPCAVVHPNVKVSLERVSTQKSFWIEPPTPVPFNPKTGFTVPVSPVAKEIYTCRGELDGQFDEVTYVTSPLQPRIDPEVEMLHDVLFHNQHRHRLPGYLTPNRTTTTSTTQQPSTVATPTRHTSSSRPKLPVPERHLVSACTPQFCGSNAECIVKDYKPYCVCLEDYTGDPKIGCHHIGDHSQHLRVEDPCNPISPCGKNSECIQINGHPLCTCIEGYYGTPPKCSPQKFHNCTKNYDCEWNEYCNTETHACEDICGGSVKFCAKQALCTGFSHMPYCTCPPGGGYVGDPYDTDGQGCQLQSERVQPEGKPSCNPSPCGRNAHCKVYSSYPLPICFCPQGFTGDPSHRCYKLSPAPIIDVFRPHYNTHPPYPTTSTTTFSPPPSAASSSISHHHSTSPDFQTTAQLCTPDFCGENARCRFRNNHPECHCLSGYKGDPYKGCHRQAISPVALRQACSVCGPNSVCSMVSSDVRCICAPDTEGVPPTCRRLSPHPSATSSHTQQNHQVSIVSTSHSSSSSSFALAHHHQVHQQHKNQLSFSSFLNHHQKFHQNSFACTSDLDCPDDMVCYTPKQKCLNPCSWACSDSAKCFVANHHVQCRCPPGFKGDPRIQCTRQPISHTQPPQSQSHQQQAIPENHPCRVTCGPNTVCRRISSTEMSKLRMKALSMESLDSERDPLQRALLKEIKRISSSNDNFNSNIGYFTECMCMTGAVGNPYSIEGCSFNNNGSNSFSNRNKTSVNINAVSSSIDNKIFSDDLEEAPSISSSSAIVIQTDPCKNPKNPCGSHSLCVAHKGRLVFCRCDYDSVGEPPNCMLRCGKDQHCLFDQACVRGKCVSTTNVEEAQRMQLQRDQFDSNLL